MGKIITTLAIAMLFAFDSYAANYALDFDGVNDYVVITDSDAWFVGGKDATWNFKLKMDSHDYYQTGVWFQMNSFFSRTHIGFLYTPGSQVVYPHIQHYAGSEWQGFGKPVSVGDWLDFAVTKAGSVWTIFMDGVQEITYFDKLPTEPSNYSGDLYIGAWGNGPDYYGGYDNLNGKIDEISFWDYAMTGQEINSLISNPLSGPEQGLVAFWDFNEGQGNVLYDKSGNGHDGNIIGTQWVSLDGPDNTPVPEPATMALFGIGGLAMAAIKRRKK